jgi:hypothetical protein
VSVVVYINGSGQVTEKELMVPWRGSARVPAGGANGNAPSTMPPIGAD